MEPVTIATRIASSAVAPIVKKLFVQEGPGAGLTDRPVRVSSLVSFRGEKRTLQDGDLRKLAAELTERASHASGPHDGPGEETRRELADALATALHSLGDLDMDDVQAVRLGPHGLARRLTPPASLSADADAHFGPLLHTACLHILDFFTRRSTFIPRTLAEQTHQLDRLINTADLLLERVPARSAEDARFEQRYAEHIARRHGELTIYGLDFGHHREWRLDAAYIPLEVTKDTPDEPDGTQQAPETPQAPGTRPTQQNAARQHAAQPPPGRRRRAPEQEQALPSGAPLAADRVLAGHERVLLRGGAGSGKTTLMQWLAVTAARQTYDEQTTHLLGRVPFVLPLRRIAHEGLPTPDRFLHAVRSNLAGAQPDGWALRVLTAGRALLLIDGVDEVPADRREETRRWLRELTGDFPGNLWLVTSRPSAAPENWLTGQGFTELSLSPMSRHDVAAFISRWHSAAEAEPGHAEALVAAVRSNPDLGRLAVNPLMCGLLCALSRERCGDLPYGRRDLLYDAALSMLLEHRDRERSVPVPDRLHLTKDTQLLLLQRLAHWMIRNGRTEMDEEDAVAQLGRSTRLVGPVEATPREILRHLLDRSGVLREPAEGRVDFVHRTFQDALGAKAAVEEGDFPLLLDNAHKDDWEDVIRMAVAYAQPRERDRLLRGLVARVPDEGEDGACGAGAGTGAGAPREAAGAGGDAGARGAAGAGGDPQPGSVRNLLLAAACLEHATDLHPAVREEVTAKTSRLFPPRSMAAARHVADVGGPMLLGLLPGPEGLTDAEAACAVVAASRTGTDAALPVLARFRDHPSLGLRRQLVWAWHRFDTDEYAREIIAHLDESDLYFTAHHTGHLRALRAMGGRARVQIAGTYHPDQLLEHLDPGRLTHLWLRDGYARHGGREWLSAFPHLHTLVVPATTPREIATLPAHLRVVRESELFSV
ncbi:NACHT domain-containing NTPase [Streptomyces sp. WMMB 322]|uniref:NACHT domain-containing protein n=1 Tax=Streptomyces sp. WMMB 322 TaxID=1286821 RepID=UPI0006E39A44|nr:NACHT domain-containing protein [Streptomyces sp. WMMB 322]SCK58317.1 NACHT domain-containing protein [Streptomyces sp. WMMB 322]